MNTFANLCSLIVAFTVGILYLQRGRNIVNPADGNVTTVDISARIPRIIHQIWDTDQIPESLAHMVASWQHVTSNYEHWLWTLDDQDLFIKSCYPEYYHRFVNYPEKINRIDAVRYFILHKFGGWYFDLDTMILRHLEPEYSQYECVLSQEALIQARLRWNASHRASNAVMACRPGHDFMRYVITSLREFDAPKARVTDRTGPAMLTELYNRYTESTPRSAVHLADPIHFMPRLTNTTLRLVEKHCHAHSTNPAHSVNYTHRTHPANLTELCAPYLQEDFTNSPKSDSYIDHIFAHYWKGVEVGETTDIFKVAPNVLRVGEMVKQVCV